MVRDCDCVPGHTCDCWEYRIEQRRFDDAVEDVHRAFCDPDHELVSDWDRQMAEALHRNGYRIIREAQWETMRLEVPRP
jgi:hypothetical protein